MLTTRAWIPVVALLLSVLAAGCSKSSSPEAGGGAPTPLKAYSLTASAADRAATLSWPSISGASTYNLYWSTGAEVNPATASKLANVTSPYTHTGLSNGIAYHYLFTAVTAAGESTPSNSVKVTPKLPRDGAPTKVAAFAGDSRITLSWAAVPNATAYSVYWNTSGDVSSNDTKVENITYPAVHTGLTNSQQYYYTVTAKTPQFGEVASAEVSTAPHIAVPSPPLSVSVSAGDQLTNLSWPVVNDATSYAIYWNTTGDVSLADAHLDVTTPNYAHSGLTNNIRYHYRIAALNTQGPSVLSAEVTAKPHAPAPGAPGNVTATASNERITLNWDPVANASQYNLYWDTGAGAAVTVIANVKPPFVHQPLPGGVPVYYTVTALRDGVESANSGQISATPLGPLPPAPVMLTRQAAKQQITLTWTAVDGALGYRVYWHTQANPTETLIPTLTPSYTHTGLLDSTTYYYRIEAITPDGISPATETRATTLAAIVPTTTGPPPANPTYTVGGNITGLISASNGLVLTLTDTSSKALIETLSITPGATVPFTFNAKLQSGGTYTIAVSALPNTPISQTCSVDIGKETVKITNTNITSVSITCTTNKFKIGGSLADVVGSGLTLGLTAGSVTQTLSVGPGATNFVFATPIASGTAYTFSVAAQPSGPSQSCSNNDIVGAVANTDVVIVINCQLNWKLVNPVPSGYTLTNVAIHGNVFVATSEINGGTGIVTGTATNGRIAWSVSTFTTPCCAYAKKAIWANNQWVAIGSLGSIFTSPNGINWLTQKSTVTSDLSNITWTGSQLVAVGAAGTILTSADGVTWVSRNSGTVNLLRDVVWTGSQLVVVGSVGTILSSTDGIVWTAQSAGAADDFSKIIWTGQRLVIGSYNSSSIRSSVDSVSWSISASNIGPVANIIWNGSQVLAVGWSGFLTSPDGITWTLRSPGVSITPTSTSSAAWNGSQYVVVGDSGIVTSPDGVVWTARYGYGQFVGVVWTGTQFIATGAYGIILTSLDGVTWTSVAPTNSSINGITRAVNLWVAVGGGIITSPDGINWTARNSGIPTESLTSVVWTGSQLVASGSSGSILTSSDGIAWTIRTSVGVGTYFNSMVWTGSQLVGAGVGGAIMTSADGAQWTARASGTTQTLRRIVWTGSQLVVVGNAGAIQTSPDGVAWTTRTSGTASDLGDVAWSGTQLLVAVNNNAVLSSTDGASWTQTLNGPTNSVVWTGNQWVDMDVFGGFSTSSDGLTWKSVNWNWDLRNVPNGSTTFLNQIIRIGTAYTAFGYGGFIYIAQ